MEKCHHNAIKRNKEKLKEIRWNLNASFVSNPDASTYTWTHSNTMLGSYFGIHDSLSSDWLDFITQFAKITASMRTAVSLTQMFCFFAFSPASSGIGWYLPSFPGATHWQPEHHDIKQEGYPTNIETSLHWLRKFRAKDECFLQFLSLIKPMTKHTPTVILFSLFVFMWSCPS